jgi:peptidylprolyl isomerase
LRAENDIRELPCGILYRVLEEGNGGNTPRLNSIVTVHYKGTLINGREFDNSWKRNYPEAFRLNEVIEGWQIALQRMHVGDHWIVYIPYAMGYGTRSSGPIPAFSTLVFDVQLLGIA